LSLGRLVSQGLATYFACFLPFLLLTTLVLSPWIALHLVRLEGLRDSRIPWSPYVDLAVHWGLAYVVTGALTFGVVRRLQGERPSLAQITTQGVRTFVRVLGTSLLCTVLILLCTLLLFVPGIIMAVRLFVAVPAAVMERRVGADAIARSTALTADSRSAIFGAWLLLKVVQIGCPMLLQFLLLAELHRNRFPSLPDIHLYYWVDTACTIVIDAFAATMAAVCYFQLLEGKENVDAKQLAAVFD
jgi:hypothetical protein